MATCTWAGDLFFTCGSFLNCHAQDTRLTKLSRTSSTASTYCKGVEYSTPAFTPSKPTIRWINASVTCQDGIAMVCRSRIRQWKIWGYVLSLHPCYASHSLLAEPIGHTSFGYSAGCGGYRIAGSWLSEGAVPAIRNNGRLAVERAHISHFGCVIQRCPPFVRYLLFLDRHYEIRQLRIFQKMVEKGLLIINTLPNLVFKCHLGQIYRQHRPVHYSPSSHSALAEAELEYKDDHVSHSVYVKFDLDSKSALNNFALEQLVGREPIQLLVWTTTPWTLTANMVRLSLRLSKKNLPWSHPGHSSTWRTNLRDCSSRWRNLDRSPRPIGAPHKILRRHGEYR